MLSSSDGAREGGVIGRGRLCKAGWISFDAEGWMSSDELADGLDALSEFVSAPGDGGGSSTSLVSASMMPRTKTPLEPAAPKGRSKPPPPFFGKRRRYKELLDCHHH